MAFPDVRLCGKSTSKTMNVRNLTWDVGFMSGFTRWMIPDGYLPDRSNGDLVSHEAVCVLNTGYEDARMVLTIFFEDRDPLECPDIVCGARRTNHIRLDKIRADNGMQIPRGVPYAVELVSTVPVVVQHSRMDTSQAELALFTTMAFPVSGV